MAAIATTPLFMRDVLLSLKAAGDPTAKEFQCNVSEARVQVTPGETISVKTLCEGGSFSSQGKPSYVLVLSGIQDWDTTTDSEGLAAYLWQHEGETLDFVLQVHGEAAVPSAATPQMTGQVTATAVDYGGEIDTYAEISAEMPCLAKPVLDVGTP
jgi:hypothetical protein